MVDFKIFQGEEMYADENKRIGFIPIRFPKPASTKTRIDVTFTYDINGILLVNVDVPDYNIHEEKVFLDDEEGVSNAKVKSVVNKLKEYKALSEKDEDNRLVMEWGKRLYAQMPPGMKDELGRRLLYFEYLLENDPYQAVKMKKHLKLYFVALEVALNSYTVSSLPFEEDWEDEEDDEMERLFKEWEKNNDDE